VCSSDLLTPAQREALPDWLPNKPVALGLDLRGGAHLVLEIDARALRREQMETLLADAQAVLRDARVGGVRGAIEGEEVVLRASTPQIAADAERALRADGRDAASPKKIELAPDGSIRLSLEPAALAAREQSALQQSVEIVRRRIDAIGVAEPTVQALGSSRILVQLPGVQDPAQIRTLLGSTAKLTFHRVESSHARGSGTVPAGAIRVQASDEAVDYGLQRRPLLQGERLVHASAGIDSQDGGRVVSFRFDDAGKRQFAQITRENVGRQLAIVLDDKVISAPVIQEPIIGGSGQIQGNFTADETASLAALLRASAQQRR